MRSGLVLLLALFLGTHVVARADDPPPEKDPFEALLEAKTDGEWRGILNGIRKDQDPAWIGRVLGALFRDRLRYGDRAQVAAYTAAYLADHAENGKVLLGEDIVRRADRDEAFLALLQRHLTAGEGGWARLLDHARTLLRDENPRRRRIGVWFLSREEKDQRETVRLDLLGQAAKDLPLLQGQAPWARDLAACYLDAFQHLLQYRFDSVEDAVRVLTELEGLDLAALIRELSRRKDLPDSPLVKRLIQRGKRLVDGVVQRGKPEQLEEFLDPAETPTRAVRRYAIQKASSMQPAPDAVWTKLLTRVLRDEEDAEVLSQALLLLEGGGFADQPDHALGLSSEVARRLAERGPQGPRAPDGLDERVRLASAIGGLRRRSAELQALLDQPALLETAVLAELVRSLGRVDGASAPEVLAIYQAHRGEDARSLAVRVAAVDALGRPGVRHGGENPRAAANALRELLTGDGDLGIGRADQDIVRQHAVRSLGSYPGEATAGVLRAIALGEEDALAPVAIVVLRKAALSDPHAAGALAEVAQAPEVKAARRIEALKALASLGRVENAASLGRAREAVRRIFTSDADQDVRREAAHAAAALADPAALELVAAWQLEDPSRPLRKGPLWDLVDAVAKTDEKHDKKVAATVEGLGGKAAWAEVDALTRQLLEQHPRNAFRRARAHLLVTQGADKDLDEADVLLQAILGPEPKDEPWGALVLRVRVKERLGTIAKDEGARKAHWLEAVGLAARSTNQDVARQGRALADKLGEAPLLGALTPEEAKRLAEDRARLEKVLQKT